MSWIPGWDTIAGAGWWSGLVFWLSIISLIGLGAFEVASHRYGERHDELVEEQRLAEKRVHDEEMARLRLETAKMQERASTAELALTRLKLTAARVLTPAQQEELRSALASLAPVDAAVGLPAAEQSNPEVRPFAQQLALLLQNSGWGNGTLYIVGLETPVGVVVGPPSIPNQKALEAVNALVRALNGVEISAMPGQPADQAGWGIEPSVRILVGKKL